MAKQFPDSLTYVCQKYVTKFQDDQFYISRCIFILQVFILCINITLGTVNIYTPSFLYQHQVPKYSFRDINFISLLIQVYLHQANFFKE